MVSPASVVAAVSTVAAAALIAEVARLRARHRSHATDSRVFLYVTFEVKPANEAAFFAAFRPLLAASIKEAGCIKYQLTRGKEDAASTYVLLEEWSSEAALARHETMAHFTTHVPKMAASAKITVQKLFPVNVQSSLMAAP
ncbi:hypothetical protein KFE25_006169 [Diacronema lutheri]|uniref:ABM domain-containing protein n=1 Tax=Diacronema lutheri TaxID=2081491 RepID=A0A8J5Y1N7_DIALT|nr:hypothetical protein KFE25_006169 [Diacronema lutheri]